MSQYNLGAASPVAAPHQHFAEAPIQYTSLSTNLIQPGSQATHYGHQEVLAQNAFDQNHRVIPGLGMGASSQYGDSLSTRAASGQVATPNHKEHVNVLVAAGRQNTTSESLDVPAHNISTDPALSDGELEDIYEPALDETLGMSKTQPSDPEDDRCGSYSPHLSPIGVVRSQRNSLGVKSAGSAALKTSPNGPVTSQDTLNLAKVERARQDARDAIMRLWPLKVRYEDYLDDGIDKSLLQKLFQELGLAYGPVTTEVPTPSGSQHATEVQLAPETSPGTAQSSEDRTESRKDRIARLLAAKRSGRQTPTVAQSPATVVETKPSQPVTKSKEKSKLLYEKMEALRKAREAKAQAASGEQQTQNKPVTLPGGPEPTTSSSAAVHPPRSEDSSPHLPTTQNEPPSVAPPQVSSPRGHPQLTAQKRPVASDFLTPVQEPPPKRPFSQTDRSRRFLIDVSEDDESDGDTAMDLDSPELRPVTLRRNVTEDSGLRNYPPLTDVPSTGRSTPISGFGRSNIGQGKEDLTKMQQDIEEMKRRIAEAEARKRAKQSRQGTPHQSPSHGRSEVSVCSPVSVSAVGNSSLSGVPKATQLGSAEAGLSLSASPGIKTQSGGEQPELRRSLSQATLDRLAVIEAERKRQTLKMKILRAQLAQMEREMAASLEEEKSLRQEASPSPVLVQAALPAPEVGRRGSTPTITRNPEPSQLNADVDVSMGSIAPQHSPMADHQTLTVATEAESSQPDELCPTMEGITESSGQVKTPADDDTTHSDTQRTRVREELDQTPPRQIDANEESTAATPSQAIEEASTGSDSEDEMSESTDSSQEDSLASMKSCSPTVELQSGHSEPDVELTADVRDQDPAPRRGLRQSASPDLSSKEEAVEGVDPGETRPTEIPAEDRLSTTNPPGSKIGTVGSTFQPYQSPLQYFHAYRFHPEFSTTVTGGLRSLTYSNKLDVRQQLCPEELLGQGCPRGDDCDFQHLTKIAAPDDQILMQLGSYGVHEGDQQEEFNKGLRKLLTEFRDQKIKDFQTISQAIIDYRSQFHKDKSRILPLGNISL